MADSLPLVFCFDGRFAKFAATATLSAMTNDPECTRIYWIFPKEAEIEATKLRRRFNERATMIMLTPVDGTSFKNWKEFDHISWPTYLRLLIHEVIDEEKVLYLDSDVLVLDPLTELRSTKLGNSLLAAVPDEVAERSTKIARPNGDVYVNAGVMLLNLKAMEGRPLLAAAEDLYSKHQNEIVWPSQDLMNKYAEGRKISLPSRWNRQTYCQVSVHNVGMVMDRTRDASVAHFIGGTKPWSVLCEPAIAQMWWEFGREIGDWRLVIRRLAHLLVGIPTMTTSKLIRICLSKAKELFDFPERSSRP